MYKITVAEKLAGKHVKFKKEITKSEKIVRTFVKLEKLMRRIVKN